MDETKKKYRKGKRFAARLKSSKGVICSDNPGPNIVLCNVGQATGLVKESILKLLEDLPPSVKLKKFVAEKSESHSFLVFNDEFSAKSFYETYNGHTIDKNSAPIYMSYVESVPNNEIICTSDTPKGLRIIEDFITNEEEKSYIELFNWDDDSNLKNRQVKHYGYEFRYGSNDVDLTSPLPEKLPVECESLWTQLRSRSIDFRIPDQLTVNKYKPGQGIPSHVDRHSPFGDTILSLSLCSPVVMDWKHHSGKYVPILVPARSLLVMQGEARYDWQHGIQPRAWDPIIEVREAGDGKRIRVVTDEKVPRGIRISLTFRSTRQGCCDCSYRTLCDSVQKNTIENDTASRLEDLHVHQVYEQIAGHFSSTRHKPWPRVVEFLQNTPTGSTVLDLGAGNGKNILKRNDILQIAGERSSALLEECRLFSAEVPMAQCVRLDLLWSPLRSGCADRVICIAVLHHFSNEQRTTSTATEVSSGDRLHEIIAKRFGYGAKLLSSF